MDVKHAFGRVDASRIAAQTARYQQDWGGGMLVFTLGYEESFAERLRAESAGGLWVLDAAAFDRIINDE